MAEMRRWRQLCGVCRGLSGLLAELPLVEESMLEASLLDELAGSETQLHQAGAVENGLDAAGERGRTVAGDDDAAFAGDSGRFPAAPVDDDNRNRACLSLQRRGGVGRLDC